MKKINKIFQKPIKFLEIPWETSHKESLEKLRKGKLFSIIFAESAATKEQLDNPKIYEKKEIEVQSPLRIKALSKFQRSFYAQEIEEALKDKKDDPNYWKIFDERVEACIQSIMKELLPKLEETQFQDLLDIQVVPKEHYKKERENIRKDLISKKTEFEFKRTHSEFPENLKKALITQNYLGCQLFGLETEDEVFVALGSGRSSHSRLGLGFYGHAFAELNKEIKIPTYLLVYDKNQKLHVIENKELLLLKSIHYRGNYKIAKELSDEILKNVSQLHLGKESLEYFSFLSGKMVEMNMI